MAHIHGCRILRPHRSGKTNYVPRNGKKSDGKLLNCALARVLRSELRGDAAIPSFERPFAVVCVTMTSVEFVRRAASVRRPFGG